MAAGRAALIAIGVLAAIGIMSVDPNLLVAVTIDAYTRSRRQRQ